MLCSSCLILIVGCALLGVYVTTEEGLYPGKPFLEVECSSIKRWYPRPDNPYSKGVEQQTTCSEYSKNNRSFLKASRAQAAREHDDSNMGLDMDLSYIENEFDRLWALGNLSV